MDPALPMETGPKGRIYGESRCFQGSLHVWPFISSSRKELTTQSNNLVWESITKGEWNPASSNYRNSYHPEPERQRVSLVNNKGLFSVLESRILQSSIPGSSKGVGRPRGWTIPVHASDDHAELVGHHSVSALATLWCQQVNLPISRSTSTSAKSFLDM